MDGLEAERSFEEFMSRFISFLSKRLPDDVLSSLRTLREKENSPLAKTVYDSMFLNLEMAEKLDRPCCQDTGVIQFFIRTGPSFPLLGKMEDILKSAVRTATRTAPLRHNAVETFDEKNTGDNTGTRVPWMHWDIVPGLAGAEIDVYMAGGGCTLPGAAKVLMPAAGYEGVADFVFEVITTYGINACPPLLVGVGVSTAAETAAVLSKKAILRPIGTRNPNPRAAEMEILMEKGLNDLGIGPQGFTGSSSVMGVHIEASARHPSTLAAAVSVGCWAHRRGTIRIGEDMTFEILTHREAHL